VFERLRQRKLAGASRLPRRNGGDNLAADLAGSTQNRAEENDHVR
jgi:hypothetical protein